MIGRWPDEDARLKVEKGPILGSGLRVCWFLVPVSRNSGSIGPGQGMAASWQATDRLEAKRRWDGSMGL